ncbi:hypothetical protein GCM10022378_19250 [Salinicoccus jeotgali]|uniref:Uncharacterized protein n=1 Tax=Salinicoccus jeotgali TaxID=381634 RepID=A0ABP7F438_9STAP
MTTKVMAFCFHTLKINYQQKADIPIVINAVPTLIKWVDRIPRKRGEYYD